MTLESIDVEPCVGWRLPTDGFTFGHKPRRAGVWQCLLEVMEVAAQVGSRLVFGVVGPKRERDIFARQMCAAVKQQVCEQRQRARRRAKSVRLARNRKPRLTEKTDLKRRRLIDHHACSV